MHVNAKKMAVSGLMLALTVIFILAGSVLESNTLFLLAAASYFVGIVLREFGARTASAFYLACVLLGFIVAPNKLYVMTYAGLGLYILVSEIVWEHMGRRVTEEKERQYIGFFWLVRFLIFNILYIPTVFLMQDILFEKKLGIGLLAVVILLGQLGLFVYDCAYRYVQSSIWNKLRRNLFQ